MKIKLFLKFTKLRIKTLSKFSLIFFNIKPVVVVNLFIEIYLLDKQVCQFLLEYLFKIR